MATEKLEICKISSTYQVPAELIQAGARSASYAIHKLSNYTWDKEDFPEQWME
jgi:hypothetical protein